MMAEQFNRRGGAVALCKKNRKQNSKTAFYVVYGATDAKSL